MKRPCHGRFAPDVSGPQIAAADAGDTISGPPPGDVIDTLECLGGMTCEDSTPEGKGGVSWA